MKRLGSKICPLVDPQGPTKIPGARPELIREAKILPIPDAFQRYIPGASWDNSDRRLC